MHWMILELEWKQTTEKLCTNWLFMVQCQNPQITVKKVLKRRSYKITAAQKLWPLNWKAESQYCWYFVEPEAITFVEPEIVFFSKGA
jgi:hypothetical protein